MMSTNAMGNHQPHFERWLRTWLATSVIREMRGATNLAQTNGTDGMKPMT